MQVIEEQHILEGSDPRALKELQKKKKERDDSDERKKTQSQKAAEGINHVKANAKLTSKVKDMKQIQLFYQNVVKEELIEKAKQHREVEEQKFIEAA